MSERRAKIQPEMLLAAGYRRYHDPTKLHRDGFPESYVASYEKLFEDEDGEKYSIHFVHSRLKQGVIDSEHMCANAQLRRGATTFNIEMLNHRETIEETETFFEELWRTMKLDYYERRR